MTCLIDIIEKRRKEAREMGRLIHPEPLLAEFRKEIRIKTRLLVLQRAGDFVEAVTAVLRSPEVWVGATAHMIVSRIFGFLIS